MVSVIFCWWIVCVTLMETWIAWRSLHHMRLAIHHIAHCFWIRGRWSCVWSKNYLQKNKISLVFRVEMQKARRLERIADKCLFKIAHRFFDCCWLLLLFFCHLHFVLRYCHHPFNKSIRIVTIWNIRIYCVTCLKYIFFLSLSHFQTRAIQSTQTTLRSYCNIFIRWEIPDPFVFIYLWQHLVWSDE